MKYYYDVTSNGICFGKFTKENWANAYAAKLVSDGFENVEVGIQDCIISTKSEFEKKMKKQP